MIVFNNTNEIKYFDIFTLKFRSEDEIISIISELNFKFTKESLNNHIQNSSFYIYTPDKYLPVVENIVPIPPKSSWSLTTNGFINKEVKTVFKTRFFSNADFLSLVNRQLNKLRDKKIGVQLSGGLDSSLIIGILRHCGFEPVLIGMCNNRYEFRTERIVQDILKKVGTKNILISDDNFLPFTDLLNVPKHALPNASSIFYSGEDKMAMLFEENKVDLVFNGMGLDTILCMSPNDIENRNQWYPFMFDDCWFRDYVYKPKNIFFTPAIKSPLLVNCIWNMRATHSEDNTKQWARNNFSNFLPIELSNFNYKADHAGLLIDGIKSNLQTINYLFEFVHNKTKFLEFSKNEFEKLFANYHLSDDNKIKLILSRTSYAVWMHSLYRT